MTWPMGQETGGLPPLALLNQEPREVARYDLGVAPLVLVAAFVRFREARFRVPGFPLSVGKLPTERFFSALVMAPTSCSVALTRLDKF